MIAFSPVRQHPEVLRLFLSHMGREPVELWVYDDNVEEESSQILRDSGVRILPKLRKLEASAYRRAEDTHKWNVPTYRRVARIKNLAIEAFLSKRASHLFLIDSDVLIRPGTVEHLRDSKEAVIASVFWTKWFPAEGRSANMWGSPPEPLREPGHHRVHGLGACTLIEKRVLRAARFVPVSGLEREGEDRWFCARARRAGYRLMMCAGHFEPFHVYRDSEIPLAREWSRKVLADVGAPIGISRASR
jgi:hypothetical protein